MKDVKLVIFKADGSKKEIPVQPGRYIVGRRPDATLRIPLPSVSRDHCEIVHDGFSVTVRDLGSSNGTFKNFERITKATLGPGDVLGVGPFNMTLQIDGKPATITPPVRDDDDDDDVMVDTPRRDEPATERAQAAPPPGSLEETITKAASIPPSRSGPQGDDSSIFEFDFDFEDDDRPKL